MNIKKCAHCEHRKVHALQLINTVKCARLSTLLNTLVRTVLTHSWETCARESHKNGQMRTNGIHHNYKDVTPNKIIQAISRNRSRGHMMYVTSSAGEVRGG